MASARKRVARKTTSSRTTQLEEKLDDLVSILRASQQQPPQSSPSSQSTPSFSPAQAFPSRLDSLATAATTTPPQPSLCATFETRPSSYRDHGPPPRAGDLNRPEPTPEEAEIYLEKFRGWIKHFPFLHIPLDVTAEALREQRPFLWRCIMNITTMSAPQQLLMKDRVRQEVAQRVIVDHERTMDILLGLICYVAW